MIHSPDVDRQTPGFRWRTYLAALMSLLSHNETMAYVKPRSLWDEFVFPRFATQEYIAGTNAPARLVFWNRLVSSKSFAIIGAAGSGKTTVMRRLALNLASRIWKGLQYFPIPVYVQLRNADSLGGIERLVLGAADKMAPGCAAHISRAIADGQAVVLLDGLDEIGTDARIAIANGIEDLRRTRPRVAIGVSCRPGSVIFEPDRYELFVLQPWSEADVDFFLRRQRYAGENNRDESYYALRAMLSDDALTSLGSMPLFLELACGRARLDGHVTTNISEVLSDIVEAWLVGWDASREIKRWSFGAVDRNSAHSVLGRVAAEMCTAPSSSEHNWVQASRVREIAPETTRELVNFLVRDIGLMRQDQRGRLRFASDSLRDFFAARHLVSCVLDDDPLWDGLFKGGVWRRVTRFAAGMASNVGRLVERVLDRWTGNTLDSALLASMLVQRPDLDRKVVLKTLSHMVNAIESLPWELRVRQDRRKGPRWATNVRASVLLKGNDEKGLIALFRNTYCSRFSRWGNEFKEVLGSSDADVCRAMAISMEHLGYFAATARTRKSRGERMTDFEVTVSDVERSPEHQTRLNRSVQSGKQSLHDKSS